MEKKRERINSFIGGEHKTENCEECLGRKRERLSPLRSESRKGGGGGVKKTATKHPSFLSVRSRAVDKQHQRGVSKQAVCWLKRGIKDEDAPGTRHKELPSKKKKRGARNLTSTAIRKKNPLTVEERVRDGSSNP